jgi:predicted transposase YdaD
MEHFLPFPTVHYDIALKTLLESSRETFFREILHEEIQRVESIEELPTETVSVRSTDFPVRVIDGSGKELIHLIEFQSDWDEEKLLSMIQYKARYREKYGLPVKSTMILFRESARAANLYEDDELRFTFRLIKLWEFPAKEFLKTETLLPLVPLMQGGLSLVREVEQRIYSSEDAHKLDNLTIFGLLLGLRDRGVSLEFFRRRRDIVIKSPMYDWILEEGIEKGREEGSHVEKCNTARAMLLAGEPLEKIARYTGLSIEEIERLK